MYKMTSVLLNFLIGLPMNGFKLLFVIMLLPKSENAFVKHL